MTAIHPDGIRNALLRSLPPEILAGLLPHLRAVDLPPRSVLNSAHAPMTVAHFVESEYVSMLAELEDGNATEVGMVGSEGMVGLPLVLGTDRSPLEAYVQSGGVALTMEADTLHRAVDTISALRHALLRYAQAFQVQVAMTAACNSQHVIEQRLARWLLMAHDRTEGDEFPMTHEFLSMMLGVRRAGITVAAGLLQRAGLIRYELGRIRVYDRPGLEAAGCECHGVVVKEMRRLLHLPSGMLGPPAG